MDMDKKNAKDIFNIQLEDKFAIFRNFTFNSKRRSLSPSNLFDQFTR